jgi:outer membrane protein TolC
MVKKFWCFWLVLFTPCFVFAQEITNLTLQQAYDLAYKNYPVWRQKDLVRRTADLNIDILQKDFLPQVTVVGQSTYQSAVTEVPIKIPGYTIEAPSKSQQKVVADLSQLIYDGGVTRQQKNFEDLNALVEDQKVEVELYQIKEKINLYYLGILYMDEQLKQVELVKSDIENGIKRVEAQVQNGTAFKSNLNSLKAELLEVDQRRIETRATKKGLVDAMAVFLGQPINENVQLEKQVINNVVYGEITRPELKLYNDQSKLIDQQNKLITARNRPKASLFAQGGYGRPGLNMLVNEFDTYYIGGLRLNWSLDGLYKTKKEREKIEVNKKIVDTEKETFLLTTNTQLVRQQAEIEKLKQLIVSDSAIIALRRTVTDASKAQLESGVITATDYLIDVNAEDQARQGLITHEVQLIQAQINYLTISGKQ